MTNLDKRIKKQRYYLAYKSLYTQPYGFPSSLVQMWELELEEGWLLKNWCSQTVVWRRFLIVPWTARRSNQLILKEINPEYSLVRLMLKMNTLDTWCEEPTHWKRPWWWERSRARGKGGGRGWDAWKASLTQWHEFEQTPEDSEGQGSLVCCSSWGHKELDTT